MASPLRYSLMNTLGRARARSGLLGPGLPAGSAPLATCSRASRSSRSGARARWGTTATGAACMTLVLRKLSETEETDHQEDDIASQDIDESLLERVDRLADWGQAAEAMEAMEAAKQFKSSEHPELLWRWGRLCYLRACQEAKAAKSRPRLLREGLAAVNRALQLDPSCGRAHQWFSVLLWTNAEYDGTLYQLKEGPRVRKHMETAAELMPRDNVIRTMLGMWYFNVAQLSWLERRIVSVSGCSVPPDCLQEALNFFQAAERVQPSGGGSCLNLLMLGKTLHLLGQPHPARRCLEKAVRSPVRNMDDQEAQLEARSLLLSWRD